MRQTTERFLAEPPEVQQHFKELSQRMREQHAEERRQEKGEASKPTPASYAA